MKKILITLCLLSTCYSAPLDQIERKIISGTALEKVRLAEEISIIINDPNMEMSVRVEAVNIVNKYNLENCIEVLINNIDVITVRNKALIPLELLYPCVGALLKIGEPAVPELTKAIGRENDQLRIRLMSYSLMKIKSKKGAIAVLDECLSPKISDEQRKRYNAAIVEVNKWHYEKPEEKK